MIEIQKLIELLTKYLEKATMPISLLEWIVNYIIPIIGTLVITLV